PDNDFGTLVKNGNNTYTYTAKDQTVYNFDTSGKMTSVVDSDSQTVTYSYTSTRLTEVDSPDGGVTTFGYATVQQQGGNVTVLSTINQPGVRTQTEVRYNGTIELQKGTDSEGTTHTFTYDGTERLTLEEWNPLKTT